MADRKQADMNDGTGAPAQSKRCSRCGLIKARSEFAKKLDGVTGRCKECLAYLRHRRHVDDPEHIREQDRARYVANDPEIMSRYGIVGFGIPEEAPVWMADKSFLAAADVRAGSEVIGWHRPKGQKYQRLCVTRVVTTSLRDSPVVRVTMESGRVLCCTPDHRWLSFYRGPEGNTETFTYVATRSGRYIQRDRSAGDLLSSLAEIVTPTLPLMPQQQREADWLAGMYDGEGSATGIAQSISHNPEVCERVEYALSVIGMPYTVSKSDKTGGRQYLITGGLRSYVNWLNWTNGTRRQWFERQVMLRVRKRRDRVMRIDLDGVQPVYRITTETGNCVIWGYATRAL